MRKIRMTKTIKILYHSDKIEKLQYIDGKSDWIDLRSAEDVSLKAGEFHLIDLGISVQLPEGFEMITAPRSSTFKRWGIIQVNSIGVVDESYCGDNDVLRMPVLATRDTEIHVNDRVCQFRSWSISPGLFLMRLKPSVTRTAAVSVPPERTERIYNISCRKIRYKIIKRNWIGSSVIFPGISRTDGCRGCICTAAVLPAQVTYWNISVSILR